MKNDRFEKGDVIPAVGEADVILAEQRAKEGEILDRCYGKLKLWLATHETHECRDSGSPEKSGLGGSWRKLLGLLRNELVELEQVRGAMFDFPKDADRSPGSLKLLPEVFTARLNGAEVLKVGGKPVSREHRSYAVWLRPGVEMAVFLQARATPGMMSLAGAQMDPLPSVEDVTLCIQEMYCWLRTNEPLRAEPVMAADPE